MDKARNSNPSTTRLVFLAVVVACAGTTALAEGGMTMIAIDSMTAGAPPPDFDFARTGQGAQGQWVVVADTTAAGGQAIEQSNADPNAYRFPLAIYRPVSARDVDVTVRFKPLAGRVDQAGGIAVRLLDPDNYYVARANALEDNVRFYHVINGKRTELKGVNIKVASGTWHAFGLRAERDQFTVIFNGKTLFTATDSTLPGAGSIGLWTKADSITRFEQIVINVLP
jgi:hypothetical protein